LGISIKAGTATDAASNPAPAAGPSATFSVDNTAPVLNSVTGPAAGSYRALQDLDFTVTYNENVTVVINTGTPSIGLTFGSSSRTASYSSGSGTSALVFRYIVQPSDNDTDGIAAISPIGLNGGTIKDAAGHDAPLTFTPPTAAITYAPAGMVKQGTTLTITATFSEEMADAPAPQFSVSGVNTAAATSMTKVDATHYTAAYVVGAGNGTATVALSTGTDV